MKKQLFGLKLEKAVAVTMRISASIIIGFLILIVLTPKAAAANPCCAIVSINQKTGIVTAKVNATGQIFQFRVNDAATLNGLKVGQGVYANFKAAQVSLDGAQPCCAIVGNLGSASASGMTSPATNRGTAATPVQPCCQITSVNQQTGIATARVNATGQVFQFRVTDSNLLRSLKTSQGVYANFKTLQVSVNGANPCCQIVSEAGSAPQAAASILPGGNMPGGNRITVCYDSRTGTNRCAFQRWGQVAGVAAPQTPGTKNILTSVPEVIASNRPVGSRFGVLAPVKFLSRAETISSAAGTASGAELIEFGVSPSVASNLIVGQTVWINQVNQAMIVQFPINAYRNDDLGNGFHMETSAKISNNGHVEARTRTWSTNCALGFEGGVVLFFYDDQGNWLHNTGQPPAQTFGVNSDCEGALGLGSSDRTDLWSDTVPQDAVGKVRSVSIVQLNAGANKWSDFMAIAKDIEDLVGTAIADYQKVAGGTPGGGSTSGSGTTTPTGTGATTPSPKSPASLGRY